MVEKDKMVPFQCSGDNQTKLTQNISGNAGTENEKRSFHYNEIS